MRLALVAQWLRAAVEDPSSRATALRYAIGITIAEVAWVLRLQVRRSRTAARRGSAADLRRARRVRAGRSRSGRSASGPATWHPHHIAERYGLFAIILLGEGVLAASIGRRPSARRGRREPRADHDRRRRARCSSSRSGGCTSSSRPATGSPSRRDRSYVWGYGHYGIFAALAALGAGLEVAVEQTGHDVAASPVVIGYAIAIPVAVFLTLLWALHTPICSPPVLRPAAVFACTAVILVLPLASAYVALGAVVVAIAVACSLLVALHIRPESRACFRAAA